MCVAVDIWCGDQETRVYSVARTEAGKARKDVPAADRRAIAATFVVSDKPCRSSPVMYGLRLRVVFLYVSRQQHIQVKKERGRKSDCKLFCLVSSVGGEYDDECATNIPAISVARVGPSFRRLEGAAQPLTHVFTATASESCLSQANCRFPDSTLGLDLTRTCKSGQQDFEDHRT